MLNKVKWRREVRKLEQYQYLGCQKMHENVHLSVVNIDFDSPALLDDGQSHHPWELASTLGKVWDS